MDRPRRLLLPWLVLAAVCSGVMLVAPGQQTIPFHIGWIGLALAYGFDPWSRRRTFTAMGVYTLVTGAMLVARAVSGVIEWDETSEIPLMCVLVALMVWHVNRREAALATVVLIAARDREQAGQRERLTRLTSHEMRTPLTIARGYVELLLLKDRDPERREDLEVVNDELSRLTRVCERLVRVIRLQEPLQLEPVDLDALLHQTSARWAAVADRTWVVHTDGGLTPFSEERLRASLDTLVENAVRYTADGDVVRLFCHRDSDMVEIGVADAGPGMNEDLMARINHGEWVFEANGPEHAPHDELSQTGLGLGLVRTVVEARNGRLVAGRAPEGGALMTMCLSVRGAAAPPVPGGEIPHGALRGAAHA